MVFAIFQNGFQKTTEPPQAKMPTFIYLSARIDFIFVLHALAEYFFLNYWRLAICIEYSAATVYFFVKNAAMNNKLVLKIVSKLAFC